MKNRYEIRGDVTALFIEKRGRTYEVLIDTYELPRLKEINNTWFLLIQNTKFNREHPEEATYYVRGKIKGVPIFLHRLLVGDHDWKTYVVDHVNGNTLDNRHANLEVVGQDVNSQNRKKLNTNNSSGINGVCWSTRERKWMVYVRPNGKSIYVGRFDSLDTATYARREAEILHYEGVRGGYSLTA